MKLNQEQLKIILDDLYAVDQGLRQYEKELESIIRDIIELEPEIKFDENFRLRLRARLMEKAARLQESPTEKKIAWQGIFGRKFSYALAGALALALIVIGGGYFAQKQGIIDFPKVSVLPQSEEFFTFKKLSLANNAFGSLKGDQTVPAGLGGGSGESADKSRSATGVGGGGGTSNIGVSQSPSTTGQGGGGMIYPSVYFKYVYTGEPLNLSDIEVEVLRRVGFDQDASSFGSLLKSFGLGMVNLGSFSSLKVQNINLAEDKDFGYTISSNVQEGSIYISQNWLKWPQPYKLCTGDTACIDQNRIKISEALSDSEVIKIAQDFVNVHGINLGSYGEPEVTDTWRVEYQKMADKSQFYIPESANVLFPLKVNNEFVYDEGGNKTGMNLSVDYRQKKVSGAGNITSQTYQASNYPAETDAAKILKVVEQGGSYWGNPVPMAERAPGSEERIIEVGTPKKEYVLFSNYSNNQTNFLLVPSLIFPVTKTPDDANYYYQKNIVVPLAKELLDQRLTPPPYVTQ